MSGIPAWAVRGARVVCICAADLSRCEYSRRCTNVVVGEMYTICHVAVMGGEVGCWLEEVINPIGDLSKGWGGESGFPLECFRPLITQSDDLEAHFRHLLDAPLSHERESA